MINKLITVTLLAFVCAISITQVAAQDKTKEHKVVIIEKEIDENGKVTEKKVVKTGAEAEAYLKNMEEEVGTEGTKMKVVRKEAYEIESEDNEGKVKIMKWDGEGEMPAEMKALMEKEGMDISDMTGKKKSRVKVKRKGSGGEEVMNFEFEGDEMPAEIKEMLEKEGIDIQEVIKGDGMKELKVTAKGKDSTPTNGGAKRAQLGVNIEAHANGVKISDVVPDSSAAIAGIQAGDVITQVDGVATREVVDLVNKISEYKPNDKVEISFERGGQPLTKTVTLKERIDPFPIKNWKSAMENGKNTETLEIELEEEIIKEKK